MTEHDPLLTDDTEIIAVEDQTVSGFVNQQLGEILIQVYDDEIESLVQHARHGSGMQQILIKGILTLFSDCYHLQQKVAELEQRLAEKE